ncbi:hypothetical protein [Planotetraspora sp. GP83]|uniref:hypothetical protein n=1 Tax=Planotetraspora sp. GP83 TaxID=3156264 RepID=UPI003515FD9F
MNVLDTTLIISPGQAAGAAIVAAARLEVEAERAATAAFVRETREKSAALMRDAALATEGVRRHAADRMPGVVVELRVSRRRVTSSRRNSGVHGRHP